jgi:hypothetical protein
LSKRQLRSVAASQETCCHLRVIRIST